MVGLFLTLSC